MRLLLFIFLFTTSFSFAGTGKIVVNTMWDCDEVKASIIQDGSVLQTLSTFAYEDITFDFLDEGQYDVEIYCDGQLTMTYSSVRVLNTFTTYLNNGEKPQRYPNDEFENERIIPSGNLQFNYGPNDFVENNQIKQSFEVESHFGLYSNTNKWFHFGYHTGLGFRSTRFLSNQTLVATNTSPLRYTNWFIPFDFSMRIGKVEDENFRQFLFDIGFNYNFPLYFKQVYTIDNHRVTTSKIHNFSDFEAYARIGFYPVQIQASYRPFNNMRSSFPEEPFMKLGISFQFSEVD